MKKQHLFLALTVAGLSLAVAAPATAADCSAVFAQGASFKLVEQRPGTQEKTVVILSVEKRQGEFLELSATSEKPATKMTLLGGASGGTAIFTNAENMRVWSCTCGKSGTVCSVEDGGFKGKVKLQKR